MALRTLSICAGVGGLDLAVDLACEYLGFGCPIPVCIIEREITAVQKLVARMEDGSVPKSAIFSDLCAFDGRRLRGFVDLIIAGLPCQPYSVAGKQRGHDDERALWPEFIRVVGEIRPAGIFLENVPEFLKYFRPVGTALSKMGYRVEEPIFVTAEECGLAHKRERVFILAHDGRLEDAARHEWGGCDGQAGSRGGGEFAKQATGWPTPRSEDAEACGNHPNAQDSLGGVSRQWTTPQAHDTHPGDSERTKRKSKRGGGTGT